MTNLDKDESRSVLVFYSAPRNETQKISLSPDEFWERFARMPHLMFRVEM
jgi:hypothetical protein